MRILYIECNMGAAGDMLMSALYELLEDKQGFVNTMNALGLPGVRLEPEKRESCGIAGTHMSVKVFGMEESEPGHEHSHGHEHGHEHGHGHDEDSHGHEHSHGQEHAGTHFHASPGSVADLIEGLSLPAEVRSHAKAVYDAIAGAEAKAHGCPVESVHFHEVGALDAVADVVGVCYALYLLHPEKIIVSPVHVGSGTVRCAHGIMPVPAPATANLLQGVPFYGGNIKGELCTPTGAALLVHFADMFGSMPVMTGMGVGIGIGSKKFEQANCVRIFLGETGVTEQDGQITELVCNIDDMTPEALGYAVSRLLELGALDAYVTPGTMKKGRPGHVLTVLCTPDKEEETARAVLSETTTNGVRARCCGKYFLKPGSREVETRWGKVRVKTASAFGITHEKPEYEDAAALARKNGIPFRDVFEEILRKKNITD